MRLWAILRWVFILLAAITIVGLGVAIFMMLAAIGAIAGPALVLIVAVIFTAIFLSEWLRGG